MTEAAARARMAGQVTIGLTGVARIVREYADAGIKFDERRIMAVIDQLQAIVEEQRDAPRRVQDDTPGEPEGLNAD